jgi:hypothetical protein
MTSWMQDAELQRITVDRTITATGVMAGVVVVMGMRPVAGVVTITSTGMVTRPVAGVVTSTGLVTIKATVMGMGMGTVAAGAGRSGGWCGWSGRIGTTRRSRSTPRSKGARRASAQSSSAWPASG